MHIRFVHLFGFALPDSSMARAQDDADGVVREIGDRWQELYNQRDFEGVAELYASDAIYVDIDGRAYEGRAAIRDGLARPLPVPSGEGNVEVTTRETGVFGEMAYGFGSYVASAPDGSLLFRGSYMTINKLVDGEWKVYRHVGNMLLPEPEASAR